MFKTLAVLTLASLAACSASPPPGTPAPTGITSNSGGGNQTVGTLPPNAGAVSTTTVR